MEIQDGALMQGDRVIIMDDLLATGGTMKAAVSLVEGNATLVGSRLRGVLFYSRGWCPGCRVHLYSRVGCPQGS